jgi:hypothetical protein
VEGLLTREAVVSRASSETPFRSTLEGALTLLPPKITLHFIKIDDGGDDDDDDDNDGDKNDVYFNRLC